MDLVQLKSGLDTFDPRLDRIPEFDPRSRDYPVRALIDTRTPRSYTWSVPVTLDQGTEGACTGFATAHELAARPVSVLGVTNGLARNLYHRARQLDAWPGESYEGSSVIAAVKAAVERGYYGEYRWAFGEDDLALAVGYKGPAILGIPWYEGMYAPDSAGFLKPSGALVGYHAILCHGISVSSGYYKVHNSWGSDWGDSGNAKISRYAMRHKLLPNQGEACIPIVRKLG